VPLSSLCENETWRHPRTTKPDNITYPNAVREEPMAQSQATCTKIWFGCVDSATCERTNRQTDRENRQADRLWRMECNPKGLRLNRHVA